MFDESKTMTLDEIEMLPPPRWLIEGLLSEESVGVLYGKPGTYKTFLALDWALTVAYGLEEWNGKKVHLPGPVFYIAAEGSRGLPKRIRAWKQSHGIQERNAHFLGHLSSVDMLNPEEVDSLINHINRRLPNPVLIVVDTLARCFCDGNEDSARDMGRFVSSLDTIKSATKATILVLHHTGKDARRGSRGSSALPGAIDTEFSLEKRKGGTSDTYTVLQCTKQKDDDDGIKTCLRPSKVADSLILVPAPEYNDRGTGSRQEAHQAHAGTNDAARILEVLIAAEGKPLKAQEIAEITGLPLKTTSNRLSDLKRTGKANNPQYGCWIAR
jgi:hypothetical protein